MEAVSTGGRPPHQRSWANDRGRPPLDSNVHRGSTGFGISDRRSGNIRPVRYRSARAMAAGANASAGISLVKLLNNGTLYSGFGTNGRVRKCVIGGTPLCGKRWVARVVEALGLDATQRRPGRPRKRESGTAGVENAT